MLSIRSFSVLCLRRWAACDASLASRMARSLSFFRWFSRCFLLSSSRSSKVGFFGAGGGGLDPTSRNTRTGFRLGKRSSGPLGWDAISCVLSPSSSCSSSSAASSCASSLFTSADTVASSEAPSLVAAAPAARAALFARQYPTASGGTVDEHTRPSCALRVCDCWHLFGMRCFGSLLARPLSCSLNATTATAPPPARRRPTTASSRPTWISDESRLQGLPISPPAAMKITASGKYVSKWHSQPSCTISLYIFSFCTLVGMNRKKALLRVRFTVCP